MCLDYDDSYEDWVLNQQTEPLDIPIARNFIEMLEISQLLADYQLLRACPVELFKKWPHINVYGTYGNHFTPVLLEEPQDIELFDRFYNKR